MYQIVQYTVILSCKRQISMNCTCIITDDTALYPGRKQFDHDDRKLRINGNLLGTVTCACVASMHINSLPIEIRDAVFVDQTMGPINWIWGCNSWIRLFPSRIGENQPLSCMSE